MTAQTPRTEDWLNVTREVDLVLRLRQPRQQNAPDPCLTSPSHVIGLSTFYAQNAYLSPSCRMRGSPALVIRPNKEDDRVAVGLFRLTRLSKLNASNRNSRRCRSENGIEKLLNAEKSTFAIPGPRSVFRPIVPNVPGALSRNAAVLNHRAMRSAVALCGSRYGSPIISTRS